MTAPSISTSRAASSIASTAAGTVSVVWTIPAGERDAVVAKPMSVSTPIAALCSASLPVTGLSRVAASATS